MVMTSRKSITYVPNPLLFWLTPCYFNFNFSQALDDEFTSVVHSMFNGSVVDFLEAVTVSCEEFVMMCKLGLGNEITGEQCCREVFAQQVSC